MSGITKEKMKDYVYTLPCKPGSVYINFGADCLNECRFCVERFGNFFGYDLGQGYSEKGIKEGLKRIESRRKDLTEIVICGIGEPFLRYDDVIEIARYSRQLFGDQVPVRADTSGLWWESNRNLTFLEHIDSLSVSLNAESEEKYIQICQPKIQNAYGILMNFIQTLSEEREKREQFPDIRLTLVDTSREELMPPKRDTDLSGECPVPDIQKCQEIADKLGFPLIVKHLFIDAHECWDPKQIESQTLSGEYLEKCAGCKTRHK